MFLSKPEYERSTAANRDGRMGWWRDARCGMFVHYGLYSQLGVNEWAMAIENHDAAEYEKLAGSFHIKEGAPRVTFCLISAPCRTAQYRPKP